MPDELRINNPIAIVLDRAAPGDLLTIIEGTIPVKECREHLAKLADKCQDDLDKIDPGRRVLQFTMSTKFRALVADRPQQEPDQAEADEDTAITQRVGRECPECGGGGVIAITPAQFHGGMTPRCTRCGGTGTLYEQADTTPTEDTRLPE